MVRTPDDCHPDMRGAVPCAMYVGVLGGGQRWHIFGTKYQWHRTSEGGVQEAVVCLDATQAC